MKSPFNHLDNYILEDDKVLLRPLAESDLEYLLPFAINEPDTWRFSQTSARSEQGMQAYINTALTNKATGKEYPFIVFDKVSGECAGSTRLGGGRPRGGGRRRGGAGGGGGGRGAGGSEH